MRNRLNTWGNKSGFLIGGKRSKISKNCNLVSSVHAYLVALFDIFSTAVVLSLRYPSSHWRICYFFDILATWPRYFFLISLHSCCLCSTLFGNGTAPVQELRSDCSAPVVRCGIRLHWAAGTGIRRLHRSPGV